MGGYAGIMFDIEKTGESGTKINTALNSAIKSCRKKGLDIGITTSHNAPYDTPSAMARTQRTWSRTGARHATTQRKSTSFLPSSTALVPKPSPNMERPHHAQWPVVTGACTRIAAPKLRLLSSIRTSTARCKLGPLEKAWMWMAGSSGNKNRCRVHLRLIPARLQCKYYM